MRVHLDFETRSELDLKKVGGAAYAAHPSTEILCIGWKINDGPTRQYRREDIRDLDLFGAPEDELYLVASQADSILVAHNAFFEQCIWKYIMAGRYGYPTIDVPRWRCTAAKAATYALPRDLNGAADALKLSVRKDMDGKRIMMKLARPRARASKANPDRFWEPDKAPEDFHRLYAYNIIDVEAESQLDDALLELRPLEQQIWFMDQRMNHYGVKLDLPAVTKAITFLDRCVAELLEEFAAITKGVVETPGQRLKFHDWLSTYGVTLLDLKAATIDKRLAQHEKDGHLPSDVARALTISRQVGRTSTAKYRAMVMRVSTDGRLKDILLYYGASRTGRWAGRGVQPQNFVRPNCDVYEVIDDLMRYDYDFFSWLYPVMDVLAEVIRGMIIADEGEQLFVADFAAVEARVNAWVSGEQSLLTMFWEGDCNYCQLAASIYNRPINKKDNPDERQLGKVGELALGYEGGINAFATMAITYRLDLDSAYPHIWASATPEERELAVKAYNAYLRGREEPVTKEFGLSADIIKQRYRLARPAIKANWKATEEAAVEACLTGRPVVCGKVTFFTHGVKVKDPAIILASGNPGDVYEVNGKLYARTSQGGCYEYDRYFLHIKLPSGRVLAYHQPELHDRRTPWGQTKKQLSYMGVDDKNRYTRIDTYGGKLVENIVQAIARDLMAEAFLRIEAAGYKPVLQVHDEAISQAPVAFGSLIQYENLMATTPTWAEGLPIKAEGWCGPRYKKG